MFDENLVPDPTAVIRRSTYFELGGYEPLVGEDYEFFMRAIAAGAVFLLRPEDDGALRITEATVFHRPRVEVETAPAAIARMKNS